MPRKRPRKTQRSQIKTVLQAFTHEYGNDIDAFDSMLLSLEKNEGVGVKKGKLAKIVFPPKAIRPRSGEIVDTPFWRKYWRKLDW